jgi:dTDP-4-amino-4,6-dideoxygalactose transaminase
MTESVPTMSFVDLQKQRERLEPGLSQAITEVVASGLYIGGPEVEELEAALAAFCGAAHCVACASGTDALLLVLKAWGVGAGDAVFVPAFTFAASAGSVANLGATPVFVDVLAETFDMDPHSLEAAVRWSRTAGLRPVAIMPVDLFGLPADYAAIEPIAEAESLRIFCDAAQSFGASLDGRRVGTIGAATATSFYPSKPLGCYGDGGAIFTDDAELAQHLRSIREHGRGAHRYDNVRIGLNSRLDAIQAAVLLQKLTIFSDELRLRQAVADRYTAGLADIVETPVGRTGAASTWAQYTLKTERRDAVAQACRRRGLPTAIHYPAALPTQPAYRNFPSAPDGVPVSERLAQTVISLPMHPYLDEAGQSRVIDAVRSAVLDERRRGAA